MIRDPRGRAASAATRSTLLRRVRDPADATGWREFVALYEPLLRAYALSRGANSTDAEDIVQDVLARLVKALPGFDLDRPRGRFRTWLWKVTCNTMADRARRRCRRDRSERDRAAPETVEPPRPWEIEEGDEPGADWITMHRRRVLAFAKAEVRARSHPRTWECFERHVLHGRPGPEVAEELGLTANAVGVNASRVLARLRNYCSTYLEELADGVDPLPG